MAGRHRDDHGKRVHKVKIGDEPQGDAQETSPDDVAAEELVQEIESMQGELEQLRKDAEESRDHYLRVLADFDNFRKRQREEVTRRISVAREDLLLKLLPIVDNFGRALQSAEQQHSYESMVEGVSLTLRQILDLLSQEGVQPVEAVGQEFNPELHEAVMRVETDEYPEGTVIEELERGYTLDGRILRPSRVSVAVRP